MTSGSPSSRAFRSQSAASTAEIAIEAMPGRPRLRIAATIAAQAPGMAIASRPRTTLGQQVADQRARSPRRHRSSRARSARRPSTSTRTSVVWSHAIGAVRLRGVGRHRVGRDLDPFDGYARFRQARMLIARAWSRHQRMAIERTRSPCRGRSWWRSCRDCGSPRASDSAKCSACLGVARAGIGGSNGSTTASTSAGFVDANAASSAGRTSSGRLAPEADAAAGLGELDEVDRLELDAVLGVAQEDHLLPLDLAERVVLDDDDLDRQLVLDRRDELAHQHREAAVADEGDDLAVGIGDLGRDGVGQARRHRRQVARARELHAAADLDDAAPPRW